MARALYIVTAPDLTPHLKTTKLARIESLMHQLQVSTAQTEKIVPIVVVQMAGESPIRVLYPFHSNFQKGRALSVRASHQQATKSDWEHAGCETRLQFYETLTII